MFHPAAALPRPAATSALPATPNVAAPPPMTTMKLSFRRSSRPGSETSTQWTQGASSAVREGTGWSGPRPGSVCQWQCGQGCRRIVNVSCFKAASSVKRKPVLMYNLKMLMEHSADKLFLQFYS